MQWTARKLDSWTCKRGAPWVYSLLWIACGLVAFENSYAQLPLGSSGSSALSPFGTTSAGGDSAQVRAWYRDYLGREPGPELSAWVQLLRSGTSPLEVQAAILGSDEFYNQKGRDVQSFVLETLQSVTWQEPTASELRRWTDRLTALRGDRIALAREILLAYDRPGIGPSVPARPSVADSATRLVSVTRILPDTISVEIGGTSQGRQAGLKAQALWEASEQFRRIVAVTGFRPTDATLTLQGVQRTVTALQATLNNPPGTAPSAASLLRQIEGIIAEAQAALRPAGSSVPTTLPTGSAGANSASQAERLMNEADAASRRIDSIIQSFEAQTPPSYNYAIVVRELDGLAGRLTSVKSAIRSGVSNHSLAWDVQSLLEQAERIGPQVLEGNPPPFTRLFWTSVESSLEQMGEILGVERFEATVLRPTPMTPSLLPLVDQAISRADVFLTGTQPLVFSIREVPRVQTDVKALKTRLLSLRQETLDGQPAAVLLDTLHSMVDDYSAAYSRWGQIAASYNLVNPPRLSPLGETLNEIERILGEQAGSDLVPATGSLSAARATRLLEALQQELRTFREQLPVIVNYPEHRSLLTYCDQMSSYLQTISALATDRTAAPDAMRRQAAGMQRVAELMLAQADSVVTRSTPTGARPPAAATNLRSQAQRVRTLAADLEGALH
ncbi:MAG: hypothetical protein MUF06_15775 [Pirellulaceae bacterium]|nr:hypothetical protein [Pirellulaceae bacterium]